MIWRFGLKVHFSLGPMVPFRFRGSPAMVKVHRKSRQGHDAVDALIKLVFRRKILPGG